MKIYNSPFIPFRFNGTYDFVLTVTIDLFKYVDDTLMTHDN